MKDENEILESLKDLKDQIKEIKVFIAGDKLNNKSGMMDIIEAHKKEIYGDESTKHIGLKDRQEDNIKRISSLEKDRLKLYAFSAGISSSIAAAFKYLFTKGP